MRTLSFVRWIANAAGRFTSPHGVVTEQNARTCSAGKREDMQREDVVAIPLRLLALSKGEDMRREDVVAIPLRLPARSINRLSRG
jgi:hypothetical protein